MIHQIKFQNFKALRDVEVTFESALTVLVGPNGSGKTSVLQGMHALSQLAVVTDNDNDVALPQLANYLSIGADAQSLTLSMTGSRPNRGGYIIGITTHDAGYIRGTLKVDDGAKQWRVESPYIDGRWLGPSRPDQLNPEDPKRFDRTAFVRFSAGQLATPTLVKTNPPRIAKDGLGLAATLSYIKLKYPQEFDAIVQAFRRVIPQISGIRFDKEKVPQSEIYENTLLVDYKAGRSANNGVQTNGKGIEGVKASHVSSGTLFALGLLTVVMSPESPNVILLDDLDHGLHPKAQMELVDVFRGLLAQNADLQIVATSHSPYILDRLKPEEVRVLAPNDDGSSACGRLKEHPKYPMWKDSMLPGEFWSHTGEDWVKNLKTEPVAQ
jgi:predicted ATPase